jgi:RNA binding exosome subunit
MAEMDKGEGSSELGLKIKKFLLNGPASINDICKDLDIAWATAKSALEEMNGKEVKEIISNPKIRIFKLSNDPAFYGIPLSYEQKCRALFMFKKIREEWGKTNDKQLLLTALQKIAVEVVKKSNLDIPVAQFHYGKVVPVFESLESPFNYEEPKDAEIIIKTIKEEIKSHKNNCNDEMDSQYENHGMVLYKSKQRFIKLLKPKSSTQVKEEDVEKATINLLMNWPSKNKDADIFSFFSEFSSDVHALIITSSFKKNTEEVKDTFNSLWDLATTYLFFEDIESKIPTNKQEIYGYIKSLQLQSKKENTAEKINYLSSFVDRTAEIKMSMDEESLAVRRILTENIEGE